MRYFVPHFLISLCVSIQSGVVCKAFSLTLDQSIAVGGLVFCSMLAVGIITQVFAQIIRK